MKKIKTLFFALLATIISSCSSGGGNNSNSSCNDIVCGGYQDPSTSTYVIYRGTLEPDTCGLTELNVNAATWNYYKAKWDANPEGYACWIGLK